MQDFEEKTNRYRSMLFRHRGMHASCIRWTINGEDSFFLTFYFRGHKTESLLL